MTANEAKKVASSLATFAGKAKAVRANGDGSIWRIELPLNNRNGRPFNLYIYHPIGNKKKIVLTDAGALVLGIKSLGTPQLKAIQDLLGTFGLKLMEDKTVMEKSNRPMPERVMSFLQAWCVVDGMLRIWDIAKEEVSNALRSAERHQEADEPV